MEETVAAINICFDYTALVRDDRQLGFGIDLPHVVPLFGFAVDQQLAYAFRRR